MNLFKPYRFLNKEQIESKANDILMQMKKEDFHLNWPFDASLVADALGIRLCWDKILPDNNGIIAAKIEPIKRLITINELFSEIKTNKGLEQSTIAHEIGHWVLHVNQDEADGIVKQLELALNCQATPQLFLCRSIDKSGYQTTLNSKVDIEWQAQYFASCLLMPRYILEEKRRGRNLQSWPHLYAMADELGVTISNLKNRLQDLGLIYIPKGSKQIYLGNSTPNGQQGLF
ncbi:MAG: ImmA/IrrE family metallo-endopeptidase [Oscillatoriaceae cyanobacterium Prado104]|jgi:Zn-dependent peptidase ImmA (M78 family)|nr:ImmA/IrrE family metallo-endopeptidase [Oscillatoriaceae cyanobacterium Prado104]